MLYNNISFRICGCQQYWSEHDLHQRESSTGARIYTQNITNNFANPIMIEYFVKILHYAIFFNKNLKELNIFFTNHNRKVGIIMCLN